MNNLNGTEKQNAFAMDVIVKNGGLENVSNCERKELFIKHATAKFIIDHKSYKLDSIINSFVEANDDFMSGLNINSVFGLEVDSDEFFDKQEEIDDLPMANLN